MRNFPERNITMDGKRHFSRVHFEAHTQVKYHNKTYRGELLDISLKGALLEIREAIPVNMGESCEITIHLPSSNINLVFEAKLVHIHQNYFGFKFVSEDIDTITHLRRLIELNIGSHEQVTGELAYWLKE
ncbi:MAG: PilZ domain-containing protein [Candidatus Kuenenia sp.]|nr:PilZ domain-containing protein [Candidatus Kuenenia hertensis]